MSERKAKTILDHLLTVGFLALFLIFANLISDRSTVSVNFSGSGYLDLQKATLSELGSLKDPITVRYYYTPNLTPPTPQYRNLQQKVMSLLRLYRENTASNMTLEVKDPADKSDRTLTDEVQEQMAKKGVLPHNVDIERKGETKTYNFISSIVITYGPTERVINKIEDVSNLEYQLTREIMYARSPELIKIGLYVPPKMGMPRGRMAQRRQPKMERIPDKNSFRGLETKLNQVGTVDRIYLEKGEHFPDPREKDDEDYIDVLFVIANRNIPKSDRYALDQYIMRGGKAVIAVDPVGLKPSRGGRFMMRRSQEQMGFLDSGIGDMLENYGVTVHDEILISPTNAQIKRLKEVQKQVGDRTYYVRKPVKQTIPLIFLGNKVVDREVPPFVDQTNQLFFMLASALEPSDNNSKERKYTPWYRTDKKSIEMDKPQVSQRQALGKLVYDTFSYDFEVASEDRMEERDLVAHVKGSFSSAYSREDIPESFQKNEEPSGAGKGAGESGSTGGNQNSSSQNNTDPNDQTRSWTPPEWKNKTEANEIVVFGDTDVFKLDRNSRFYRRFWKDKGTFPNNEFVKSLAEFIGKEIGNEEELQSESASTPVLKDLGEGERRLYQTLMLGLSPLLVILIGLFRFMVLTLKRKE